MATVRITSHLRLLSLATRVFIYSKNGIGNEAKSAIPENRILFDFETPQYFDLFHLKINKKNENNA